MANLDRVALRYAKAAFDFLADPKKAAAVAAEITAFSAALEQNAELRGALENEAFSVDERCAVVKDITEKMGLSQDTTRILGVLAENRRVTRAGSVAVRLNQLALAAADVAALDVESSEELPAADRKKIEEQFSKLLGKKVEAHYSIQSQLLGGLRVTAAGRTYDGTLSGWLEKMEEKIMGGHL